MAAKSLMLEFERQQYVTVNQIAQKLTLHHRSVRKLIAKGELKSVKLGGKRLVLLTDFLNYCKTNCVNE